MNAPLTSLTLRKVRRAQPWLGTLVSIEATGLAPVQLTHAIERAFRAVARVHALMSFHDPDSELSRVNREAYTRPVTISGHLRRVLATAARLSALSGGRFDITTAGTLVRWGYLPKPTGSGKTGGDWRDIHLAGDGSVRLKRPVLLDLGGIAKGYAVDLAIGVLRRAGVPEACVNAGGDLRFYGTQARQILVRDPADATRLHVLPAMSAAAIATSCASASRRRYGTGWRTPLVDPLNQRACAASSSVTVVARSCLYADALTKPVAIDAVAAAPLLRRLRAQALVLYAA